MNLGINHRSSLKLVLILTITAFSFLLTTNSEASNGKVLHEKTFNVSAGGKLVLKADVGDAKVETWNEDKVYVEISGNSKAEDEIEFRFEQTSNGVEIIADKESDGWFSWSSGFDLNFHFKVPKEFNITLKTAGGDLETMNLMGDVEMKTSGGDIKLHNVDGEIELGTSGGDIDGKEITGNLNAGTSGGDIDLSVQGGKISAKTSGGDIKLRYSGENLGIERGTSGGDIDILLPSDIKADVFLRTSGGDIEVNYPNADYSVMKSYKYEGKLNGGGNLIEAKTSGGDVNLREN